jgi:hypothetical protein
MIRGSSPTKLASFCTKLQLSKFESMPTEECSHSTFRLSCSVLQSLVVSGFMVLQLANLTIGIVMTYVVLQFSVVIMFLQALTAWTSGSTPAAGIQVMIRTSTPMQQACDAEVGRSAAAQATAAIHRHHETAISSILDFSEWWSTRIFWLSLLAFSGLFQELNTHFCMVK